jgi:hypothetical protein
MTVQPPCFRDIRGITQRSTIPLRQQAGDEGDIGDSRSSLETMTAHLAVRAANAAASCGRRARAVRGTRTFPCCFDAAPDQEAAISALLDKERAKSNLPSNLPMRSTARIAKRVALRSPAWNVSMSA